MSISYKSAGVDLNAGEETINRIKEHAKFTFTKNVLTGIGHFGAFFEADFSGYKNPVLVSSVDGVGTKLKIAFAMNKHNTIGQDLVNHCVNDIAVGGAKPLYFMDYLAFGKLYPEKAEQIVEGFSIACRENGVALIGGETAEMPGLYDDNEYDISGTIVGVVDKEKIINGSNVQAGNVMIGFKSTGLHTNGYSLARKVLSAKYNWTDIPDSFENRVGDELLKVHKSYLQLIELLKSKIKIKAFSHITGGGIFGNTKRVVPKNLNMVVDWRSWEPPAIFKLIKQTGDISDEEMRKAFNLGIGLVAIVDKNDVERTLELSKTIDEAGIIIGKITG